MGIQLNLEKFGKEDLLHQRLITDFPGFVAFHVDYAAYCFGCAAYTVCCAVYAVGCAAHAAGCAIHMCQCEDKANSVQLSWS